MALSDKELAVFVRITGDYETSGKGYAMVAGDFDAQGLSCGVLQWNIGQSSFQPMVIAPGEALVRMLMPSLGAAFWKACHEPIGKALAIVRGWQTGHAPGLTARRELVALMTSTGMIAEQDKGIRATARRAETEADAWAEARGGGGRTMREIAFFFDVAT